MNFKINEAKRQATFYEKEEGEGLKITLGYQKGGMNYLTYETNNRGFYVTVMQVTLEKNTLSSGEHYTTESFTMFKGLKSLVAVAKRYNKKELYKLVSEYEVAIPAMVKAYNAELSSSNLVETPVSSTSFKMALKAMSESVK